MYFFLILEEAGDNDIKYTSGSIKSGMESYIFNDSMYSLPKIYAKRINSK